jgi:hypothetical protein
LANKKACSVRAGFFVWVIVGEETPRNLAQYLYNGYLKAKFR